MTSLHAAIVDDEPLARSRLRRLLEKVSGNRIKMVAECVDVDELMEVSREVQIDVLFLDIELPGGNGFTALRRWNGKTPMVVFVTAYEQHGVQAFADRAVDYLLKPVSTERLRETVMRLEERALVTRKNSEPPGKKIAFNIGRRTTLVSEDAIQVIRANGNYLDIETSIGTFTRRQPLMEFLDSLTDNRFIRIHRSIAIKTSSIDGFLAIGSGRYMINLACGKSVVSGRAYREVVQALVVADKTVDEDFRS